MSCVVRIPGASVRRADPTPSPKHALRASPRAATVRPTANMFCAALTSRSWTRPPAGQVQWRMSSVKESSTWPRAEQRLLLGSHWSIPTSVRPYQPAL
jgi:hypothetical protein